MADIYMKHFQLYTNLSWANLEIEALAYQNFVTKDYYQCNHTFSLMSSYYFMYQQEF